jgi:hypothetical protein
MTRVFVPQDKAFVRYGADTLARDSVKRNKRESENSIVSISDRFSGIERLHPVLIRSCGKNH